jgi:phage shock protein A
MFTPETRMIKTWVTLMRGQVASAGEEVADRHALTILDQQMRDAALTLDRARKALAVAIAHHRRERQQLQATQTKIADLETRAVAAIQAGCDELAAEAADVIAGLEAERDASAAACALFAAEIQKLNAHLREQQLRLTQLERGRRVARAAGSVRRARRGRIETASLFESTLSEAEATLARLRERQAETEAAETAFDMLDIADSPAAVTERLAAQGFGPRTKPDAADVLARLRQRAAAANPTSNV